MINVTIVKSNNKIITIEATGHSGYAESGSDIVCASVSSLTQALINGLIEVVKINPKYVIDEEIPHLSVTLPNDLTEEKSKYAQVLMSSTCLAIKGVADSYPKFIKIKEKQND